jgi:hypothetical protein
MSSLHFWVDEPWSIGIVVLGVLGLWVLWKWMRRPALPVKPIAPDRNEDHEPDLDLGLALARRILDSKWIHRRVESIRFESQRRVRWHVSIDVEVPISLKRQHFDVDYSRSWCVVPLTFLDKRRRYNDRDVLRDFDLVDESGRALPLLTSYELALAAWSVLCAAAGFGVPEVTTELSLAEKELLWLIAAGPSFDAGVGLLELSARAQQYATTRQDDDRYPSLVKAWEASAAFVYLVQTLSFQFLLIAHTEPDESARRIFKFTHDVAYGWFESSGLILARVLGWTSQSMDFRGSSPLPCSSLHFEVHMPDHVDIVEAYAWVELLTAGGAALIDAEEDTQIHEHRSISHVYLNDIEAGAHVSSLIAVRPTLESPQIMTLLMAAVLSTALWWGSEHPKALLDNVSSTATLLLLLPGLIAGAVVLRHDHQVVSRLLLGFRAFVVLLLVGAAVAAGDVIAARGKAQEVSDVWGRLAWVAAVIGGIIVLGVAFSWLGRLRARTNRWVK